jgi:hypothetical protein
MKDLKILVITFVSFLALNIAVFAQKDTPIVYNDSSNILLNDGDYKGTEFVVEPKESRELDFWLTDSPWPTYRGDFQRTGRINTSFEGQPKEKWRVDLDDDGDWGNSTTLLFDKNDNIYVNTRYRMVKVSSTGGVLYNEYLISDYFMSSIINDTMLFFNVDGAFLIKNTSFIDIDTILRPRTHYGCVITNTSIITGGTCFNPDLTEKWITQPYYEAKTVFLLNNGNTIVVIGLQNELQCKEPISGELRYTIHKTNGNICPIMFDDNNNLIVSSFDDTLYSFQDSLLNWKIGGYRFPYCTNRGYALSSDNGIVFMNYDEKLVKVSDGGQIVWEIQLTSSSYSGITIDKDDKIYFYNSSYLYCYNNDGTLLFKYNFPDWPGGSLNYQPIINSQNEIICIIGDELLCIGICSETTIVNNIDDVITCLGSDVELTVSADGERPYEYSWFGPNGLIQNASDSVLVINNIDNNDQGGYYCEIENTCSNFIYSDTAIVQIDIVNTSPIEGAAECLIEEQYEYYVNGNNNSTYVWKSFGGNIISGQGSSSCIIVWNNEGQMQLQVEEFSINGCLGDKIIKTVMVSPDGIEEQNESLVKIYPNPANDHLIIESKLNISKVELIDKQGKIVIISKRNVISTNELSNGIYLVSIYFENDKKVHYKVVVKH